MTLRALSGGTPWAFLVAGFAVLASTASAKTWYVSTTGSDSAAGTSTATAFLTLQHAASVTGPGDTVYVSAGTYAPPCSGCDVVRILTPGTSASPITFSALAGARPILNSSGSWQAIHIDASYITINGFEVEGDAQSVPQSQQDQQTATSAGNGIDVEPIPCPYTDTGDDCRFVTAKPCTSSTSKTSQVPPCFIHGGTTPSHIVINNNLVHDEPGSGIEVDYADYITVTNNTVHDNANWSPNGQSGISLYELTDIDTVTSYKNYVMDNDVYWNQQLADTITYPGGVKQDNGITDGNGIIIDDNEKTQTPGGVAYNGRTLVANNVLDHNGGSGAHAYFSQHVDFVANTANQNQQTVPPNHQKGELFSFDGADVNFYSNIIQPTYGYNYMSSTTDQTGSNSNNSNNGSNVYQDYNLLYCPPPSGSRTQCGTTVTVSGGPHNPLNANPQFNNPSVGDFSIGATSPARSVGTSTMEPATDIVGTARPQAHGYDIGAYESLR